MAATDFPPFPTVHIIDRRTNTVLQELTIGVQRVEWTQRARRFGTGSLTVEAEDLGRTALAAILAGNAGVHIAREWTQTLPGGTQVPHSDEVWGPITSAVASDGTRLVVRHEFMPLRNEVVVLGQGEGAARTVVRRSDLASQAVYGLRETVTDARNIETTPGLETRGDVALAKLGITRQVLAGGASGTGFTWVLNFADNLVYLLWRHVETEGLDSVNTTAVPAGEYIAELLADNLTAPGLARRRIDVPATVLDATGIGSTVTLPVRWDNLADAVEQAAVAGGLQLSAVVNPGTLQTEFRAFAVADRTADSTRAIIYGQTFADAARYDIRAGDLITVEEFFRQDSTSPDLSVNALCNARRVIAVHGQPDEITLEVGAEVSGLDDLIRAGDRRTTPVRFS